MVYTAFCLHFLNKIDPIFHFHFHASCSRSSSPELAQISKFRRAFQEKEVKEADNDDGQKGEEMKKKKKGNGKNVFTMLMMMIYDIN